MTKKPTTDVIADNVIDDVGAGLTVAEMARHGRPTRTDDTVVIEGGRPATLDEVQAYIAADGASRRNG